MQLQVNTFTSTKSGDRWALDVKAEYKVVSNGVQNVLFQVCPKTPAFTEEVRRRERKKRRMHARAKYNEHLPFLEETKWPHSARFF